jgi:pilus assembly protein CpaB
MNRRLLMVLLFAMVISAGASYAIYRIAGSRQNAGSAAPASKVVVAARNLEIGTLIHDSDLRTANWTGPAPRSAMTKKDGALNRGVVSAIYEGEPVTESRLASTGSGGGLAATIPPGMRACAVKVNEVVGVAGFVIPGMRVDVLITGVPPGASAQGGAAVRTLLQNIQVLSAGANIDKDKEGKPQQVQVVNLLVTPQQAEVLSLAGNETRIQLILRNPMDTGLTTPPGTVISDLFGQPKPRIPVPSEGMRLLPVIRDPTPHPHIDPPASPDLYAIEVFNGGVRTVARFKSPGDIQ